jgi:hypothetical protein
VLKLRYTPLQVRVLSVEEDASPHRGAVAGCPGLEGTPVLAAELHSQAGAAAIAAKAAAPHLRVVLVHLDTAALPFAISRLAHRLRGDGVLAAAVTAGQSFGGDLEAVNVYSGLLAAKAVARAGLIIVTQGPGNAGTGTKYGFSGLALAEALHAAALLGGRPILAPRISDADARPRHQGVSHHTATLLECLRVPVDVVFPPGAPPPPVGLERHTATVVDPAAVMPALAPYKDLLATMGRTTEADPLFFRAAAAAGLHAARLADLEPGA